MPRRSPPQLTSQQQILDGGVVVPAPYEVWADGVYQCKANAAPAIADIDMDLPPVLLQGRSRLTHRPLWIAGLGHTVDTEEPLIQLAFTDLVGTVQKQWLSRGLITEEKLLVSLGANNVPVDSLNAKGVLAYLRALESSNGVVLPILKVGHRSGPYLLDGKLGWLIGRQWIGADPGLQADPRSNQKYAAAFMPSGDAAAWYEKWRELRECSWVVRFLIGATFAPPMLRLLKCRTFIVHHWGDSSGGKTAASVFALSAWGNPELLYSSLNRTAISLTEIFKHLTDLPVLYDEKQVATVSSEEIIYSICTGSGRERGAKDGGLRQDRQQWLTIARTTGEVPLITDGDVGGQFNRVLQVHSVAFQNKRDAERIYPFTTDNYGHAGPAFLRQLAEVLHSDGGWEIVKRLNAEMREALVNRIGIDGNHAQYAAIIATAQTLAESWLLGIDITVARERALDDATLALKETAPKKQLSYSERALSKLRDHWVSNLYNYIDDTTEEGKERAMRVGRLVGIETTFGMILIPHEANDLLIRAGYAPERVWRDFHRQGWLVPGADGGPLTHSTLRNGKSLDHPVYLIKPDVFYNDSVRMTRQLQMLQGGLSNVVGLEQS